MARSAVVATALAATAVAAVLTGCRSDPEPPPDAGVNRDRPIEPGDSYVALGDSYTAAFRTGPTDRESGPCKRSLRNYPNLLADELGLELTDVSCGGATTDDVLAPARKADGTVVPAQINAITDDTDLVTIGLGANDVRLYDAVVVNCVQLGAQDPDGAPCRTIAEDRPREAERRIDDLQERLLRVISEVLDEAPQARVVVVGYPQSFPREGPCDELPLAAGDYSWAFETSEQVTDALKSAAARARAEYVDVWTPTRGHDMCSDEPWIAGADPERTDGFAYHPFPEEQELVADLLARRLAPASGS